MTLFTKIGEFVESNRILGFIAHVYRNGIMSGLGNKRLDYEGFKKQCTTMVKMRYLNKEDFIRFESLLMGIKDYYLYHHSDSSLFEILSRNNSIILDNTSSKFQIMYSYFFEQVKLRHIDFNKNHNINDFKIFIHNLGVKYGYLSNNPFVDNINPMQLQ